MKKKIPSIPSMAAFMGGLMCLRGCGTDKNGKLAVKYLQMARARGISDANKRFTEARNLQKEQAAPEGN